jgi:segregation and condensation protein A
MGKPSFKLEVFEGPLDLLLKLISKNKINIHDIPIALVLDQYLESIDGIDKLDMEQASEFLVMAAYLMYIKSQTLLPRQEEEEEDPRDNLVRMLLEYKRYKEVAGKLTDMFKKTGVRAVREPLVLKATPDGPYEGSHTVEELADAYGSAVQTVKRRMPPPISNFKGIVNTVYTSISTRVVSILRRLIKGQEMTLSDAFKGSNSRSDVVATFLAVLEMISKMRITVDGEGDAARITLRKDRKEHGE